MKQKPIHCAAPDGVDCTGCPGKKPPLKWLFRRDGGRCYLCGDEVESLDDGNRDHVTPRARGGKDSCKNLRLTHRECNFEKADMPLDLIREEYGWA